MSVDPEEVVLLQCLEAIVVKLEVPIVQHCPVKTVLVGHDNVEHLLAHQRHRLTGIGILVVMEGGHDLREGHLRLLVEVGNLDLRRKDRIVGKLGHEVVAVWATSLSGPVVVTPG